MNANTAQVSDQMNANTARLRDQMNANTARLGDQMNANTAQVSDQMNANTARLRDQMNANTARLGDQVSAIGSQMNANTAQLSGQMNANTAQVSAIRDQVKDNVHTMQTKIEEYTDNANQQEKRIIEEVHGGSFIYRAKDALNATRKFFTRDKSKENAAPAEPAM
jgi:hypothetical protein